MTVAVKASQVGSLDMRLEVLVIPVSDVDRAKQFYGGLGWKLDADFAFDDGFRVIQFTPPGSRASVLFGTNVTAAAPGSARDGEIADLRRRVRAARWPDRETVSDPSEGVRTQYRILVNLLADNAGKPMGALGYRRSPIDVERPQRLVDPAKIDRLPSGQDDNRSTCGDRT